MLSVSSLSLKSALKQANRESNISDSNKDSSPRGIEELTIADNEPSQDKSSKSSKRKVTFSMTVRVCLIPLSEEYSLIKHLLWWNDQEIGIVIREAYAELIEVIQEHDCTVKKATSILYHSKNVDECFVLLDPNKTSH